MIRPHIMAQQNNRLLEEINQAEYLQEICLEAPHITIGTQCGIGMYNFKRIGYRDRKLILEFKLVMDTRRTDCERIAYNFGDRAVLTAAQFLYAYKYNAFA